MSQVIWLASTNKNKIEEMKVFFEPHGYSIKSLLDINQKFKISENGSTYEENAYLKAKALSDYLIETKAEDADIVIADDSGLELDGLQDFPGIYSDRWRGDMTYYEAMEYILKKLDIKQNYKARMVAAIVCIDNKNNVTKTFMGRLKGTITETISPLGGFGYDPFFYVTRLKKTLNEATLKQKNRISHRGLAMKQLLEYLNSDHEE